MRLDIAFAVLFCLGQQGRANQSPLVAIDKKSMPSVRAASNSHTDRTRIVMRRLSDRRVSQFWDPQHLVAKKMAGDARPPQPAPRCCDYDGVLWDLVAIYPGGRKWNSALPPAIVFDGPVFNLENAIADALENAK